MNIWFKLTPDQASDFQVPWEIAANPESSFYSTLPLSNLYHSGPWLLLSFQSIAERPFTVTFQPCTVELSFINEFESFNPLNETQSGLLPLNREELGGLIELLATYADQMLNGHVRPHHTFEEIKPEQWDNFHLYTNPATSACQSAHQRVYLQVDDPAADLRDDSIVTLVVFTTTPGRHLQEFHRSSQPLCRIAFRQFSLSQLSDPQFTPLDQAVSRIDLDKYGMVELAMLLQVAQKDLSTLALDIFSNLEWCPNQIAILE